MTVDAVAQAHAADLVTQDAHDVHYRNGGTHAGWKPDSNRCYFRRMHTGQSRDCMGNVYHDEATYSVILNGLVRVAGKTKTGALLYEATDAGRTFAQAS